MINKKIISEIYRKLDGELPENLSRELEEYFAVHPEAGQQFKEREKLKILIEGEKEQIIDIDLKKEILNRINMEAYTQKEKKPEIKVVRSIWIRPAFRLGFVFVLGVFVGFMIFAFFKADFRGAKEATPEMKGTLYNSSSFDDMKTADVLQYDSPLAKAICNVRYSTKIVEIRVELSSLYPVRSTLEFDFNNFEVLNVQNVSVNDQTTAMAASNFIQFNNVGDNKFIIQLYNKNKLPHYIEFKIYQNDTPIYQNSVQVNKE
ncbi:MAG: hypothetical protein M0Q38_03915 [Bacteroidales bacterium]|jgi:hypothetical protein|nr:hypothetical protein [Bacteroidales bacterium]